MPDRTTDELRQQFGTISRISLVLGAAGSLAALFWGLKAVCGVWAGLE